VDRRRLLAMAESDAQEVVHAKPDSILATALADIWRTHLQVGEIEVTDDFFALGGHSLMATQIIFEINRRFSCALRLTDIMQAPTVAQLSERVLDQLVGDVAAGKGAMNGAAMSLAAH
jgi:acyl carrier protein